MDQVRRRLIITVLTITMLGAGVPAAFGAIGALEDTPASEIPLPDPGVLDPVPAGECAPEEGNAYEQAEWDATVGGTLEHLPEGACKRIRVAFGPLTVKPGQNDALVSPQVIEKPAVDGKILRFKPDLVLADGSKPDIDYIHLHHAVWLTGDEGLGMTGGAPLTWNDDILPFFGGGEEKTQGRLPAGYGYPVKADDTWLLVWMVHNYTPQPDTVWITMDIDFVPDSALAGTPHENAIEPVYPFWSDVYRHRIANNSRSTGANPVFNVHKGYGHCEDADGNRTSQDDDNNPVTPDTDWPCSPTQDGEDTQRVCTWPEENCANFDPWGDVSAHQGEAAKGPRCGRPLAGCETLNGSTYQNALGNTKTTGELRTADTGTMVWAAGHLHPGGIRNDLYLQRGNQRRSIFVSEGVAWDRDDPYGDGGAEGLGRAGGPHDSWDFSMTVTGAHLGWKVRVNEGDRFRITSTYDAEISWYENMGLDLGFIDPHFDTDGDGRDDDDALDADGKRIHGEPDGLYDADSIDPFAATSVANVPATDLDGDGNADDTPVPEGGSWRDAECTPSATTLCTRGVPTHAHLTEADNFGGCPEGGCPDIEAEPSDEVTDTIPVTGFNYGQASQGVIDATDTIPTVKACENPNDPDEECGVRFVNADAAADVWHTITRCEYPCNGASGLDYPVADGADDDPLTNDDYDSAEIGFGLFLSPAKVHVDEELQKWGWPWYHYFTSTVPDWMTSMYENQAPSPPPETPEPVLTPDTEELKEGVLWDFRPAADEIDPAGETVTFYCRIHIGMRGAVQIVPETD